MALKCISEEEFKPSNFKVAFSSCFHEISLEIHLRKWLEGQNGNILENIRILEVTSKRTATKSFYFIVNVKHLDFHMLIPSQTTLQATNRSSTSILPTEDTQGPSSWGDSINFFISCTFVSNPHHDQHVLILCRFQDTSYKPITWMDKTSAAKLDRQWCLEWRANSSSRGAVALNATGLLPVVTEDHWFWTDKFLWFKDGSQDYFRLTCCFCDRFLWDSNSKMILHSLPNYA